MYYLRKELGFIRTTLFIVLVLVGVFISSTSALAARTGVSLAFYSATSTESSTPVSIIASVTDDGDNNMTAKIILTDGDNGGVFTGGTVGGACSADLGTGPQSITVSSGTTNKGFCYKNSIPGIYTISVQAQVDDLDVGAPATIEVEVTAPVCAPQYNVGGPTTIHNSSNDEYFTSVNDALTDCDTTDGDEIELLGDILSFGQINITRPITFNGNGHALFSNFSKTSNINDSAIRIDSTHDVVLKNVTLNGIDGVNLNGVNVSLSLGISFEEITLENYTNNGVNIDGATVSVSNLTTSENGHNAIRVYSELNPAHQSILNINSKSNHEEVSPDVNPHIFVDDNSNSLITINDVDNQYSKTSLPVGSALADIYTLNLNSPATTTETEEEVVTVKRTSSGTKINRKAIIPSGAVRGTSTTATASSTECIMFINDYLKKGWANNEFEVAKLQHFLTSQGLYTPVTGYFGDITDKNVKTFQQQHQTDILAPWVKAGLMDGLVANGFVYKTTRAYINNLVCPGAEPTPLIE